MKTVGKRYDGDWVEIEVSDEEYAKAEKYARTSLGLAEDEDYGDVWEEFMDRIAEYFKSELDAVAAGDGFDYYKDLRQSYWTGKV